MDAYNPGFFGKLLASLSAVGNAGGLPVDCRTQLISMHDIRIFAATALTDPDKWADHGVALDSDNISFGEPEDVFRRTIGEDLLQTYDIPAHPVLWLVKDTSKSLEWLRTVGYLWYIYF